MENQKKQNKIRVYALDALRGLAILCMILSGNIPATLPAWMFHAQCPPPTRAFNPDIAGITWVDLVFPFFLFAMGAAFPFAMTSRIAKGATKLQLSFQTLVRGLLLAFFAIYIQHIKPWAIDPSPDTKVWLLSLLGFLLLFPMMLRLPKTVNKWVQYAIKAGGFVAGIALILLIEYPDGKGFSFYRSDIIILVLANVAFFGTLIWIFTKDNNLLRLGILGVLLALRLTQSVDDSWNQWIWTASPFPWLYKFYYLQYLFIVIPGTIVGDFVLKWISEYKKDSSAPKQHNIKRMYVVAAMMFIFVVFNLWSLFTRHLTIGLLGNIALAISTHFIFGYSTDKTLLFLKNLFHWGTFWLFAGLAFEAFEGGIKKDSSTVSYYLLTTGLAIYTYILLTVLIDYVRKQKYFGLLIHSGQNPMIAYLGASNVVIPVLALTQVNTYFNMLDTYPWLGFVKGLIITLLVSLIAAFFAKKKLYWRT